jgi:hypothetical protein
MSSSAGFGVDRQYCLGTVTDAGKAVFTRVHKPCRQATGAAHVSLVVLDTIVLADTTHCVLEHHAHQAWRKMARVACHLPPNGRPPCPSSWSKMRACVSSDCPARVVAW